MVMYLPGRQRRQAVRANSLPKDSRDDRPAVLDGDHVQLLQTETSISSALQASERYAQPADKVELHPAPVVDSGPVAPALAKVGAHLAHVGWREAWDGRVERRRLLCDVSAARTWEGRTRCTSS